MFLCPRRGFRAFSGGCGQGVARVRAFLRGNVMYYSFNASFKRFSF